MKNNCNDAWMNEWKELCINEYKTTKYKKIMKCLEEDILMQKKM